ncbi:MAG: SMC-Scp complex subunit ScpB [Phycisphaerales bacterium]|nr:SMC-Scp complex subunit ScpB [Phycisphaerales bacterium]
MGTEDGSNELAGMGQASELDAVSSVEAVLLSADKAISEAKVAEALAEAGVDCDSAAVRKAVDELNAAYEATGRAFRIERVAGGLRVMTLPDYAPAVAAVQGLRAETRLSRAAVETLAIVAYRQPITRASIESIRGVASGEVLRGLLERKLVMIAGRAEELGRPMLYGTTKRFLELFGLGSLKDLPPVGEALSLIGALSDRAIEPKTAAGDDAQDASEDSVPVAESIDA